MTDNEKNQVWNDALEAVISHFNDEGMGLHTSEVVSRVKGLKKEAIRACPCCDGEMGISEFNSVKRVECTRCNFAFQAELGKREFFNFLNKTPKRFDEA